MRQQPDTVDPAAAYEAAVSRIHRMTDALVVAEAQIIDLRRRAGMLEIQLSDVRRQLENVTAPDEDEDQAEEVMSDGAGCTVCPRDCGTADTPAEVLR